MRSLFLVSFLALGCAARPLVPNAPSASANPAAVDEPPAARAVDPGPARTAVDALVQTSVRGEKIKGVVVGLVSHGATQVYGYGRAADTDDASVPTGDTVFEIGSVTKVFTSVLLAEMAERKLLAIDAPLRDVLPKGVTLDGEAAGEVKLVHLATHTSRLPRLPDNLDPKDPSNPYIDYERSQLFSYLSSHRLDRRPGTAFEYSNLGPSILGQILALRSGRRYEDLVLDWIAGPLGMKSTSIGLPSIARGKMATGHDPDGAPAHGWDLGVFEGAGGLHSTVNDLLRFLKANIDLSDPSISSALALTQIPRFARPGGRVALGWMVGLAASPLDAIRWHNGRTGGFASFVGFDRQRQVGVVVLANSCCPVDALGTGLLKLLVDPKGAASETPVAHIEDGAAGTSVDAPG